MAGDTTHDLPRRFGDFSYVGLIDMFVRQKSCVCPTQRLRFLSLQVFIMICLTTSTPLLLRRTVPPQCYYPGRYVHGSIGAAVEDSI